METGRSIADILTGSWRASPPPLSALPPLFASARQVLLKTSAAGLAWRRLSRTEFRNLPDSVPLHQAFRLHTLQAAIHEQETAQAFDYLRSAGVEPILGKGWAIARLYPERGLRPYGDIDLFVRPENYERAERALRSPSVPGLPMDIQRGCRDLNKDRSWDQIYSRSELVRLGEAEIRVLGQEDHLRLLCVHLLGHGAFRPLWLCDVAVVMESLKADFDWDYFLSGELRRTDWIECTMGLAHSVLGARLGNWPICARARNLPGWLTPALLKQWSAREFYILDTSPLWAYHSQPSKAFHAMRLRWPNPIQATVELGARFNELPRAPLQVADCIRRAALFLSRLAAGRSS